MAKEWYLLNPPFDGCGDLGNEDFNSAKNDFNEMLGTGMATDVEICNHDLSSCKKARVVIQGNTPDSELKVFKRVMLAPINTCKSGMYVKYKNRYWLIAGLVDNNGIYEKALLRLCNHLLTWINEKGDIVQRWCNVVSAARYNDGLKDSKFYVLRSDQLLVSLPDDEEILMLPDQKRFIIDKRTFLYARGYDNTVTSDTTKPLMTYKLSRLGSVLYDSLDSGYVEFIASQDEKRDTDGYYVINDKGYWLCQTPSTPLPPQTGQNSCEIVASEPYVYNGLDESVFQAVFRDGSGAAVKVQPRWRISCDFVDQLSVRYDGDFVYISCDNAKLVNKSFELFLVADNYKEVHTTIYVRAFL